MLIQPPKKETEGAFGRIAYKNHRKLYSLPSWERDGYASQASQFKAIYPIGLLQRMAAQGNDVAKKALEL